MEEGWDLVLNSNLGGMISYSTFYRNVISASI